MKVLCVCLCLIALISTAYSQCTIGDTTSGLYLDSTATIPFGSMRNITRKLNEPNLLSLGISNGDVSPPSITCNNGLTSLTKSAANPVSCSYTMVAASSFKSASIEYDPAEVEVIFVNTPSWK